jgi:hypothetical protein
MASVGTDRAITGKMRKDRNEIPKLKQELETL